LKEILWLDPVPPHSAELAALTRDSVLPLALKFYPCPGLIAGRAIDRCRRAAIVYETGSDIAP
jgi:hypothetical protein